MIVLVALTVGLVFWLAAWSLGLKATDAFLVTMLLVLSAAAWRLVEPYLSQFLGREAPGPGES